MEVLVYRLYFYLFISFHIIHWQYFTPEVTLYWNQNQSKMQIFPIFVRMENIEHSFKQAKSLFQLVVYDWQTFVKYIYIYILNIFCLFKSALNVFWKKICLKISTLWRNCKKWFTFWCNFLKLRAFGSRLKLWKMHVYICTKKTFSAVKIWCPC